VRNVLLTKLDTLKEKKREGAARLQEIKDMLHAKKEAIAKKTERIQQISANLQRIDKFEQEKLCDGKYYQEVLKAFKTKLVEDNKGSLNTL